MPRILRPAVDQCDHESRRERVKACRCVGKTLGEDRYLAGWSLTRLPILRAIIRKPSHLISCSQTAPEGGCWAFVGRHGAMSPTAERGGRDDIANSVCNRRYPRSRNRCRRDSFPFDRTSDTGAFNTSDEGLAHPISNMRKWPSRSRLALLTRRLPYEVIMAAPNVSD